MNHTKIFFKGDGPRIVLFFNEDQEKNIPKELNPVVYYNSKMNPHNNDAEIYIYEIDFPKKEEHKFLLTEAASIRYHPSDTILLIPKIRSAINHKNDHMNMILICEEIFNTHFGEEFKKNFHYYLLQDDRLMFAVNEEFAKKLYAQDFILRYSMTETCRFFLRYYICECFNESCTCQYHTVHNPQMPIISLKCLQFKKLDFTKIKEATTLLSANTKTITHYNLAFKSTTLKCIEILNEDIKIFEETFLYQECPDTPTSPLMNSDSFSEIVSSINHECIISSICIEFTHKIDNQPNHLPNCNVYMNSDSNNKCMVMLDINHNKDLFTKRESRVKEITITNLVSFHWLKQKSILFMIKNSDIVLSIRVPMHVPITIKAIESGVTKFSFNDEKIEILYNNAAIHSIQDTCLFLRCVEKSN